MLSAVIILNDNPNYGILIFFIIILFILFVRLFLKFRKEKNRRSYFEREAQKLYNANALLKADQLKFQLQPHTLKNILANLKMIANKMNKGMDGLSETLEYILYKGNDHFVSVHEEIGFIRKYLDLNDLFISEIDSIQLYENEVNRNSDYYTNPCIPHLITAYFIENAFRHGNVNHPEFLKIHVKLNNSRFEILVINKYRPKKIQKTGGGLGLKNMRERLDLLHEGKYAIKNSCNEEEYHSNLIINF